MYWFKINLDNQYIDHKSTWKDNICPIIKNVTIETFVYDNLHDILKKLQQFLEINTNIATILYKHKGNIFIEYECEMYNFGNKYEYVSIKTIDEHHKITGRNGSKMYYFKHQWN